ncbi:MAG: hypothetical protein JW986_06565 [Methanotrichaceae archaeon]|nr:hypothetical protein [Methanotrichaceae archaeon]
MTSVLAFALSLFLIALPVAYGEAVYFDEEPLIVASTFASPLEAGRSGILCVDLENAAVSGGQGANSSAALWLRAALSSLDSDLLVLSGPQVMGSLGPGAVRRARFQVSVLEGAEVGLHPIELNLTFGRLSGMEVLGDPGFPEIYLIYQNSSQVIPIEASVLEGPRLEVQVEGVLAPGESELEVAVVNRGIAIDDLSVLPRVSKPLEYKGEAIHLGRVDGGDRAAARFSVEAGETLSEYCPISFQLDYLVDGSPRREDLGVVMEAGERGLGWILRPALVLLLILAAGGIVRLTIPHLHRRPSLRRRRF